MLEIDVVSEQENKKSDVFIVSVLGYTIGIVSMLIISLKKH